MAYQFPQEKRGSFETLFDLSVITPRLRPELAVIWFNLVEGVSAICGAEETVCSEFSDSCGTRLSGARRP